MKKTVFSLATIILFFLPLLAEAGNWHTINNYSYCVCPYSGKVYFAFETLREVDRSTLAVKTFEPVYQMTTQDYAVITVSVDSTGAIFLGTKGMGYFVMENDSWVNYNHNNSELPPGAILDISTAPNGDIYISTQSEGFLLISNGKSTVYNVSNSGLISDSVRKVRFNSGRAYICTNKGVSVFDGVNWSKIDLPETEVFAYSIYFDQQNNIYISTKWNGIFIYDGTQWKNYNTGNSGILYNKINDIAVDVKGNIWMVSDSGLIQYDRTKWTVYNTSNSPLKENLLLYLYPDPNGNIWISSIYHLYIFNPDGVNSVEERIIAGTTPLYPNPADDYISLNMPGIDSAHPEIVNLFGIAQEAAFDGKGFDVRGLNPGVYFVVVRNSDNSVKGYKFIKR